MGTPEVDENVLRRLRSQLSRGEVILFTGAGFSLGAKNGNGVLLATVAELKVALWDIAFPGEPFDEDSSLGDVFDVALRTASTRTKLLLEDRLRVDGASLPHEYGVWFSMPWARTYTLNVDDLDEVVGRTFDIPRELIVVSALTPEDEVRRVALHHLRRRGGGMEDADAGDIDARRGE